MAAKDVPVAARLRKADLDQPAQVGPRRTRIRALLRGLTHEQHRNALYLGLNLAAQAAAGLLFWLVLTRLLRLEAETIGIGYATIALGTIAAVVAKGGLDTALLRHVPTAGRSQADRLLRFAVLVGAGIAVLACLVLAATGLWPDLKPVHWLLAGTIAVLLVATWLQDAVFLAEGRTRSGTLRNLAAAAIRIVLPAILVALAIGPVVPLAWALALTGAAVLGSALANRLPDRVGPEVPRRAFLASVGRNAAGSAAEFLPGLMLAPIVLITRDADEAAYFGMAWTLASMLFLASAAISRSALASLVKPDPAGGAGAPDPTPACVRRGALQNTAVVGPAAIALLALAPLLLGLFGRDYVTAAPALALLAASAFVVAPSYLYLALLRARDRAAPLVLFPLAQLLALAALAPWMADRWGLVGVAAAWLLANLPFGVWGTWRLHQESREVKHDTLPVRGAAHLE